MKAMSFLISFLVAMSYSGRDLIVVQERMLILCIKINIVIVFRQIFVILSN